MAFDPELEAHKTWLGYLQPEGLVVSPHELRRKGVVLSQDVSAIQARVAAVAPPVDDKAFIGSFAQFAREVLEWPLAQLAGSPGGPLVPESFCVPLPEFGDVLRPTHALLDAEGRVLLPVWELAPGTELDRAVEGSGWSASPEARMERLLREHGDGGHGSDLLAGLLCNGKELRLVVAPRGESSGYVTWPVAPLTQVAGRPLLAALVMLLGAHRLLDAPADSRLPQLLKESRKYQSVVSTQLADQVLYGLWELLRGLQGADALSTDKFLSRLAREHPEQIYGGLLTVMLRLVFVLFAEHRGLFPSDIVFQENYAVSGLFERLRADAGRYPDTMDQRYGAWAALLALFRLVHRGGGHAARFSLPARHGELFDPARYPFLEGAFTAHDTLERFESPKVSDGCVLRVLEALLVLDGERLTYRALDVEQIGSVYEAMMGFKVEAAHGVSVAVRPDHVVVDLEALLATSAGERAKRLKESAACDLAPKAQAALKTACTQDELLAAVGNRISRFTPRPVPVGGLYLQPTEERRRSGSHYTPRELTAPIVETTLAPILRELGTSPTAVQLLSLKVCDPAMGSGAFLVETCRQLAEHVVRAWERHGGMPKLAPDEDALLHARRLVAQRCLYGVDRNPFAVGLAKLSVWLVTLARDHAFTFLDHALKHGDSLLGLTRERIERFHWLPEADAGPLFAGVKASTRRAASLRARIGGEHEGSEAAQTLDLKEANDEVHAARRLGDLVLLAFMSREKPKERESFRALLRERLRRALDGDPEELASLDAELSHRKSEEPPFAPFHWELEFPEVFQREQAGFDAVVGNPPFAGKTTLAKGNPKGYVDWLCALHDEANGNADLVAHFFRRAFALLRLGGAFGLIATNTIAQGDTRAAGLRFLCGQGGVIFEARRRYKWPVPGAAVIVSVIHVRKGAHDSPPILDGERVQRISAYLFHKGGNEDPHRLRANAGKSFQGVIVLGLGFTFDDTNKDDGANSISEMQRLIEKDARNAERIFSYLGGEELNESPTHAPHRFVINFGEMSYDEALVGWPDLMGIVERRVKPGRATKDARKYPRMVHEWWKFWNSRPDLHSAIAVHRRVLVCGQTSKYRSFTFVPARNMAFDQKLVVFPFEGARALALLSSRLHERWALFFGSTMKDDPVYTPTDCFETFPFPTGWEMNAALESAGREYDSFRANLMVDNDEGLTKTYNRFHDPNEQDPRIHKLRELHAALDRAVLDAYGWTDLAPTCDFELEYEIDEAEYANRKKPWRYRWNEAMRDEVLARLLSLNQARAEEERLTGKAAPVPDAPKKTRKAGRSKQKPQGPGLFGDQDK